MQTLNTYRLKILREVAARGTLAAAAEALHLTGPAVSHQMTTLERELGVALFEHTRRSIRLTAAGRSLVRHSETILADCEAAVAEVESFASEISGTVHIAIIETVSQLLGSMVVAERKRHPRLEIVLVSRRPFRALPALRTGDLDIVLSNDWECLPAAEIIGTTRHDLLTELYFAVLPPSHPLAGDAGPVRLMELADEPWCVTQEEAFRDALELTWRSEGFQPRIVFESIYSRAIASAAERELGVGVIPGSTDLRGMNVVCRPIAETSLLRRVFALVRSGSEGSPPVRAVLDAMDAGAALAMEAQIASDLPHP